VLARSDAHPWSHAAARMRLWPHVGGRQSCAELVASLLPELLGAPGEAAAAARAAVVAELREALGGFVSPSLEALIPAGAPGPARHSLIGLVARATWLQTNALSCCYPQVGWAGCDRMLLTVPQGASQT